MIVFSLLLIAQTAAQTAGAPESVFKSAVEDFEFGEHAQAAEKLRSVLEPILLASREDVIVARQYLGACYHLLNDRTKAKKEFSMLLALDPTHKLDPEVFSPALVQFFEEVRTEAGLALRGEPEPKESPPPPPVATALPQAPPAGVVSSPAPEPHGLGWALIPFGVGQFANGHNGRGALFLASELGLFGASIATFAMFESLKIREVDGQGNLIREGFRPEDSDRAGSLQTAYLVTFWAGVAVTALGIVEALVSHPGAAAPEVPVSGQVSAGPGSLTIHF